MPLLALILLTVLYTTKLSSEPSSPQHLPARFYNSAQLEVFTKITMMDFYPVLCSRLSLALHLVTIAANALWIAACIEEAGY